MRNFYCYFKNENNKFGNSHFLYKYTISITNELEKLGFPNSLKTKVQELQIPPVNGKSFPFRCLARMP